MKRIVFIFLMFSTLSTQAQLKDSTISAIYTDYKTYWATSITSKSSIRPDSSHNLLGFTFRGKAYSTGVNDATLNTKLGSGNYSAQVFKALPIKNIAGTVIAGGATNLAFALKNDGDSTKAAYSSPYPTIHIADLLMDGKNGLDLGTGVTNLPKGGHISFPIKNLDPKRATDAIPDLVFTQIAEPTTNQPDTIFFFDENNNVVGNKKLVYWNSVNTLGTYKLDLYTLTPKISCNTSIMNGLFEQNGTRDIRMVAFLMTEFGITTKLAAQVKGIQINPNGSSDQAFIAYNANTINLDVPSFTAQPLTQVLCSPSVTSSTFNVSATSTTELSYQWKKNGEAIAGATLASYTATGLTLADTDNVYSVTVSNSVGSVSSNNASVRYIILSQPSPVKQYLATGNAASFSGITTSGATSLQWQKNGSSISGASAASYSIPVVNPADSGKYTVAVSYSGGTCTSEAAVLKTSVVLYAKATGSFTSPATWGVEADGSGSTPVDFSREEHTFVAANRAVIETGSDITIAGTLDVANGKVVITPGTTLNAGRIIRSLSTGSIAASAAASLTVHGIASSAYAGASDLYFDAGNNTIKNVVTSAHTVTLRNALNITSGKNAGMLQVASGTFVTSDSLTLKSDSLGTASIARSAGTISGKVTIEKFIHARRAWRFIGAPVSSTDAPTINAAWQEGAASSTDNPHPGYGTHITYGAIADGFDQNPQKSFSMKVLTNGVWVGVPATKKTLVTDYPAYMLFIRGNRSYNITSTTSSTTPTTTLLRVTGNVYQGSLAGKTVSANGFTMVINPYASPVNVAKIISNSSNVKKRFRVWDPTMAGTYGVGAWVTVNGTTGSYRTTPPSPNVSTILQAGQGIMIESGDEVNTGSFIVGEEDKDLTAATTSGDREGEAARDTSLEINLKLFNADSSAALADGVLYNFNANANDSVDLYDASKIWNFSESLAIKEGSHFLTIDSRTLPVKEDSLRLGLYSVKAVKYQLEFVPSSLQNKVFALYDKYLNTTTPISVTDTTRYTFTPTSVAASKASDRFTIVVQKTRTVLPVTFTGIKAYAKEKAVQVEWSVANEVNIAFYEVQRSANGADFSLAGTVTATAADAYRFTDATPASGISYYRVKSVGKDGEVRYTNIVNVQMEAATASSAVSVYPNPLTGTSFTLTLGNMAAGTYTISVTNGNGTKLFSKQITHNGGTASQKVTMTNSLPAGVHFLTVTDQNGTASLLKVAAAN